MGYRVANFSFGSIGKSTSTFGGRESGQVGQNGPDLPSLSVLQGPSGHAAVNVGNQVVGNLVSDSRQPSAIQ